MRETNRVIVTEYLAWQTTMRKRSASTVYMYRSTLAAFLYEHGHKDWSRISVEVLETWLLRPRQGRAHGKSGSAATILKDASILRSMFRFATERGFLDRNPAALLAPPTPRNVQPKALPDEVWHGLWDAAETPDERLLLGLGFYVGLRRAEMVQLRGHQFDLDRERIVAFRRKGGGEDSTHYGTMCRVFDRKLPHLWFEQFRGVLHDAVLIRQGDWLLTVADGNPVSAHTARTRGLLEGQADPMWINRMISQVSERAGVGHVTPHQLRHSCATNMLRAGVPIALVSRLLNHSSIQTTMRYVKAGGDELAAWLDSA